MDAALDDQLGSGNQRRIAQFLCDDLKTSFFNVSRKDIFQFYLHLLFLQSLFQNLIDFFHIKVRPQALGQLVILTFL